MTFRAFLYALARFLGDVNAIQKERVGRRIGRRVAGRLTGRMFRRLFGAWLLVCIGATGAIAQQRVDLFDQKGRRTGYAVADRQSGRVDFYDANSRRTGWGRLEPSGKVGRFRVDGRRQGETVLPLRPIERR